MKDAGSEDGMMLPLNVLIVFLKNLPSIRSWYTSLSSVSSFGNEVPSVGIDIEAAIRAPVLVPAIRSK